MQAAGASPAVPLLEQAAAEVAFPAGGAAAIVVADYGLSAGRNSLAPIGRALAILRGRAGRERAISVVHTDLRIDPRAHEPAVFAGGL